MSPPPEEQSVPAKEVEVLLQLAEIRGQLTTFIQLMTGQGEQLTTLNAEVGKLRDRVTSIEAAKTATAKATPQWWVWVPAVVTVAALFLTLAQQLYGGK